MKTAEESGVEIVLPTDVVVASKFGGRRGARGRPLPTHRRHAVRGVRSGLDIGPDTSARFAEVIRDSEDRLLERPDGRVRARAVRGRDEGRRAGAHGGRRVSASWAAATRRPPCVSSGSPTTSSDTSRRAAEQAWSSSRARSSPDWRSSDGSSSDARTPLIAGNWKMNLDHQQAIAFVQKLHWALKEAKHLTARRGRALPAVHRPATVQTLLDADKIPFALGGSGPVDEGLRRLHGRGLRARS